MPPPPLAMVCTSLLLDGGFIAVIHKREVVLDHLLFMDGATTEGRGQRAEGRGQRAEGRGQRAEGRGQMGAEDRYSEYGAGARYSE